MTRSEFKERAPGYRIVFENALFYPERQWLGLVWFRPTIGYGGRKSLDQAIECAVEDYTLRTTRPEVVWP